jgi:hypothetical protein
MRGITRGFGAALLFRVYPDSGDDLAAHCRGSIENPHSRTLHAGEGHSSDCGQAQRDYDNLDVQVPPEEKTWSVLSAFEQLRKPRGALRRRQPMLNRNHRLFHSHFLSARDAPVLPIPAIEVASHIGARARRRAAAVAKTLMGHLGS